MLIETSITLDRAHRWPFAEHREDLGGASNGSYSCLQLVRENDRLSYGSVAQTGLERYGICHLFFLLIN